MREGRDGCGIKDIVSLATVNISATKEKRRGEGEERSKHDGLKHFYSGLDGRRRPPTRNDSDDSCSSEGRVKGKKAKVSRSFSGWLSDIITGSVPAHRRLTVAVPSREEEFLSPLPPNVYFVSRHCPFFSVPHGIAGPTRRDIGSIF